MTVRKVVSLAAAVMLLPLSAPAWQTIDEVKVTAVRFYRADASLTQVKAFVQVPLTALEVSSQGGLAYRVAIQLKDSTGLTLAEEAWPMQHAPAELREPGAFTVNSVEFNIRPGKYRLDVTVEDSVGGRRLQAGTDLTGYSTPPNASDLVISTRMRPYMPDSQVLATEWRNGQILVTSIAQVNLSPTAAGGSRIFYLLEAYTPAADSGTMQVTVRDSAGKQIVQTPPAPVRLAAGGGVLRGQLNLEGLPPGNYHLVVAVDVAGRVTERSAQFSMADLQDELERQALLAQARRITDEGYFALMGEEELDRAAEPLEYIASGRDLRAYQGASVEAKRRFLVNFWTKRDPDTTDLRNPVREEFYGKIAYADSTYRERGSNTTPGWKTDRGRIFALHGAPDEKLERVRAGRAPTYQVWRFTRRRDSWYIFADRSGLESFKLIHTNDRSEAGNPDWKAILGPDAVRDVGLFLGVDFFGD